MKPPRHPRVQIILHSHNPLAWVSGVRSALRSSGVPQDEIARFSTDALSRGDAETTWEVIRGWVDARRA